jgi:hypothetical protein
LFDVEIETVADAPAVSFGGQQLDAEDKAKLAEQFHQRSAMFWSLRSYVAELQV